MGKHRYRENIPAENNAEECIIAGEIVEIMPEEIEEIVEEPVEEPTVILDPTETSIKVKVVANKLNIRSSKDSSSDSNIIGMLFKDDEVSGTFEENWFKLDTDGYVMADFVK